MATQIASMYGVLSLDDSDFQRGMKNADTQMGGLTGTLDSMSDKFFKAGTKFSVISDPLRRFGEEGINVAADFEGAMKEISARTGIVGKDLESIRSLSLKMGADTVFSAQDAADAFLQLLSSGQSAEEAIATLPDVLEAAAASGEDLGTTADTITDIMASFGIQVKQFEDGSSSAGYVVNQLAKAAGASSADMASLGQGFANVGNVASSFGLDVNETSAILAVFAENGIKGAEAGTTLKSMLLNMTRPTDNVKGAWKKLGISFYDTAGNVRDINDVLKDLDTALDPLPAEEQNEIMQTLAGSYGIMGLSALRGSISIDEMQRRMSESADAGAVAEAKMDTFNGAVDSLKGSVETFQIQALTPLMEKGLKPLVEEATKVINKITEWATENPETATTIILILGAVAALAPVLIGLGAILSVVSGAVGLLAGAVTFLLSPIGLAIAAAVAIGAAYATNFGGIRDFIDTQVRPILERFFEFLGQVWEQVRPALESIFNWFMTEGLPAIQTFIEQTVLPAIQTFFNFIAGVWELIRPALESIFNWFMTEGLPAIQTFIEQTVQPVVEGFFNFIEGIWNLVGPILTKFADWFIKDGLPGIQKVLEDIWHNVFEPFIALLQAIWDKVRPGFESFANGVKAILQPIIDLIEKITGALGDIGNRAGGLTSAGEAATSIGEGISSGQYSVNDVIKATGQAISSEITGAAIGVSQGGAVGSPGVFGSRDSGGPGDAGMPYMIGTGAQPELFIPRTAGTFVPNADQMGGININGMTIIASGAAEGRAAGDAFYDRIEELDRARG